MSTFSGRSSSQQLAGVKLNAFGAGSGFLGMPGDVTPALPFCTGCFQSDCPVFIRRGNSLAGFHILNNFDIPIGIEHPLGKADIPSATQWTSVVDLTTGKCIIKQPIILFGA
ncbi:MAG: linear amide C-N hydrolase [Odoribacter splanchnicus]